MKTITETPQRVSAAGRQILAAAVSIDHDWALRFSSEDKLTEAVKDLAAEDLEAAALLVRHLLEAIVCSQIRHDREAARRADA